MTPEELEKLVGENTKGERFTTPLPKEVNQRTQQRNAKSSI